MDRYHYSTPSIARGVTEKTRREVVADDAALIDACAAFAAAHEEQNRTDDEVWNNDDLADAVSDRWYAALEAVLDAPDPVTRAGCVALAKAAHTALVDECGIPRGGSIAETATREQQLALRALSMVTGA